MCVHLIRCRRKDLLARVAKRANIGQVWHGGLDHVPAYKWTTDDEFAKMEALIFALILFASLFARRNKMR